MFRRSTVDLTVNFCWAEGLSIVHTNYQYAIPVTSIQLSMFPSARTNRPVIQLRFLSSGANGHGLTNLRIFGNPELEGQSLSWGKSRLKRECKWISFPFSLFVDRGPYRPILGSCQITKTKLVLLLFSCASRPYGVIFWYKNRFIFVAPVLITGSPT